MLKTVSSITNAIGALNYKGTWDANSNTPTLTSSVGTKGDYYVVSIAGTTTLNGISNWGVGDLATFNGSVWQRVEGGADLNGVNLSVSGTSTLSGLTASTALALNASKEVVSITNTGTGNNVLATSPSIDTPTLTGNVNLSTGNLIVSNGKGVDFSATPGTGTSELLADYEEGTWTPTLTGSATYLVQDGRYTKVGRLVFIRGTLYVNAIGSGTTASLSGLPFTAVDSNPCSVQIGGSAQAFSGVYGYISGTAVNITYNAALATSNQTAANVFTALTYIDFSGCYSV